MTRFLRKLPKGKLASRDKVGGRPQIPLLLEDGSPLLIEGPISANINLER